MANCALRKLFDFVNPARIKLNQIRTRLFHQGLEGAESLLFSTANAACICEAPQELHNSYESVPKTETSVYLFGDIAALSGISRSRQISRGDS
jgi:hypothetical protein